MTKRKSQTSDAVRGNIGAGKGGDKKSAAGDRASAASAAYLDPDTALAERAESEDRSMAYIARRILQEQLA